MLESSIAFMPPTNLRTLKILDTLSERVSEFTTTFRGPMRVICGNLGAFANRKKRWNLSFSANTRKKDVFKNATVVRLSKIVVVCHSTISWILNEKRLESVAQG